MMAVFSKELEDWHSNSCMKPLLLASHFCFQPANVLAYFPYKRFIFLSSCLCSAIASSKHCVQLALYQCHTQERGHFQVTTRASLSCDTPQCHPQHLGATVKCDTWLLLSIIIVLYAVIFFIFATTFFPVHPQSEGPEFASRADCYTGQVGWLHHEESRSEQGWATVQGGVCAGSHGQWDHANDAGGNSKSKQFAFHTEEAQQQCCQRCCHWRQQHQVRQESDSVGDEAKEREQVHSSLGHTTMLRLTWSAAEAAGSFNAKSIEVNTQRAWSLQAARGFFSVSFRKTQSGGITAGDLTHTFVSVWLWLPGMPYA